MFPTSVNTINFCKLSKETPLIPQVKAEEVTRCGGNTVLTKVSTKDSATKRAVRCFCQLLPTYPLQRLWPT